MWQFGDYDQIRGEANMKTWVISDEKIQREIFEACCLVDKEAEKARDKIVGTTDVDIDPDDI